MRIQVTVEIDTETGQARLLGQATIEDARDLLGERPVPRKGRTPLDQALTTLIDGFRLHPDRPGVLVPTWNADKKRLRPYVEAKGPARIKEMLDAFVKRHSWSWDTSEFNVQCVLGQPLTIAGFVTCIDRLDMLLDWESKEVPFGPEQATAARKG